MSDQAKKNLVLSFLYDQNVINFISFLLSVITFFLLNRSTKFSWKFNLSIAMRFETKNFD